MAKNDSSGAFLLGLVLGGAIGAMAGLLLAPKSGVETRAELMERGEAWRTRADVMAADMRARGMDEFNRMNERVGPAVDTVRERGYAAATTAREAGAGAVATAGERVGPVVDAARERGYAAATAAREAGAGAVASAGERVGPVVDAARERGTTAAASVRSRIGGNGAGADAPEAEEETRQS